MENVENTLVITDVTRTDLSDWSGAPVEYENPPLDVIQIDDDRVQVDYMDYAKRGYDLLSEGYSMPYLNYGPSSAPLRLFHLNALFQNSVIIQGMLQNFEGLAYDSVEFRVTTSNPKGIAGGYVVGVYPYTPWHDQGFSNQASYFNLNNMTRQHLMLSPQSHLMTYGEAHDVVFDVPWQYNVPYLPRNYINNQDDTNGALNLWPGTPVLYITNLGAAYVSSVSLPAIIKVFVKFANLRFSAPCVLPPTVSRKKPLAKGKGYVSQSYDLSLELESQSGIETLAPIATSMISLAATKAGEEIMGSMFPAAQVAAESSTSYGTFESPQAVQLAFVGDSTKVGKPPTTPIFRDWGPGCPKHKIMDLISLPQYLETISSGVQKTLYANPTAPRSISDIQGADQCCTYLRFFSQLATFWRGTIIFDAVIMGHPMVEVSYKFKISYPPWSITTTETYSQNSILQGVCSGIYRVQIPMPYMSLRDHMPIIDNVTLGNADVLSVSSSIVECEIDIVSTALDQPPVINTAYFIRAGPDFHFYQPWAVGLGFVAENNPLPDFESQCGLPEVAEVFQTRAKVTKPTNQMFPIDTFEDIMSIWSRALPYATYDGSDEPIINIQQSVQPYWYPMNDSAAMRTLNVNNSWWVTNDYVSFLSSMYLYFKGSLGFKILCVPGTGYKYLSLTTGTDMRQPGHNPFTSTSTQLPPQANFGFGTVATDLGGQPVLEVTIPLKCSFEWTWCNFAQTNSFLDGYFADTTTCGALYTNVNLHMPSGDLLDALYRKAGPDFSLAVRTLLPPPTLWLAKGYNWS
jgi:hypothetical protein